jgi:putative flippase GtrA
MFLNYIKVVVKNNAKQLIKFSLVGLLGSFVNFYVYYLSVKSFYLGINSAAVIAFSFAVTSNFLFNYYWTFSIENLNRKISFQSYLFYVIVNLKGLLVNLMTLNLIVSFFGYEKHLLGQAIGISAGMISNFFYAKKIVFKSQRINP